MHDNTVALRTLSESESYCGRSSSAIFPLRNPALEHKHRSCILVQPKSVPVAGPRYWRDIQVPTGNRPGQTPETTTIPIAMPVGNNESIQDG